MGAKHFVEFICTGNTTVMKSAFAYAGAAGIPIGWMSNRPAGEYVGAVLLPSRSGCGIDLIFLEKPVEH